MVYKRFKAIEANHEPQRNKGWHCNKLCSYGPMGTGHCDAIWSEIQQLGFEFVTNKYTVLKSQKQIRK
jgi:hypothetical protein